MGSIGILSGLCGGSSIFLSFRREEEGRNVRRGKARPRLELAKKDAATHMSLLIPGIVVVLLRRRTLGVSES